jgi:hypothetical protein
MSNELVKVSDELVNALDRAAENGLLAQQQTSQFKRTFMVAEAVNELRAILTPKVMDYFMKLQNTSIGFKTDRPKDGYPVDVVRDCVIDAAMNGVYCVGNEMNIIAGQCYITKNGFGHKLREIPDFSWIETPGIPKFMGDKGALIEYQLEWNHRGKKGEKTLNLAIRVNAGMGADAIIGKASRKARAWLYATVTGMEVGDGDADDAIVIDAKEEDAKSPFEQQPIQDVEEAEQDQLPM